MRALYGQAQALPASLFDLGISSHINASIIITMLLILPKDLLPFRWANRLRDARKEGKGVSCSTGGECDMWQELPSQCLLPGPHLFGRCGNYHMHSSMH